MPEKKSTHYPTSDPASDPANDPDGECLPIKLDSTSNGEFAPQPLSKANQLANQLAHEAASRNARRAGLGRRSFLVSTCGAASTLLAFNQANALADKKGGFFDLAAEAAEDPALAADALEGKEFIFDVQGHFVNPTGKWLEGVPADAKPFSGMPSTRNCGSGEGRDYLNCIGPEAFVKDVFMDSDTDMMVLSFIPSAEEGMPLTIEEADATRRIVDEMEGTHRLMIHGRVNPNQAGDIERMDELVGKWGIAAWKTYTQWGPEGVGFWLDDEDTGIPFIEKGRALGVNNICVHKGLAFGPQSIEHAGCEDIGRVAKLYPEMNFIVYHSGLMMDTKEQAFEPDAGRKGIDTLVQSVLDNGIRPGGNVYAELGSTWRFLMRDPDQAAHAIGKLLKYVGEDNVLWGTDSIWYGSPQDQIQAFRSFQISKEYQERFGYPEITPEIRAKVFGLNATKPYEVSAEEVLKRASGDAVGLKKANYLEQRDPHFRTYGPKTRREFLNLIRANGGSRL